MNVSRKLLALPAAGVLLAALAVPGVGAAEEAPAGTAVLPPGQTWTVTLLTGDVVSVQARPSGCPMVSVRPAEPSGVLSRQCRPDGHVHVVPAKVAPLVGKVLDPALFDVTSLILNGYDDARSRTLPLIVRPGGNAARLTADPLVAGLAGQRALPSIGAVAGHQAKAAGPKLMQASARATAPAAKVWLDRKKHVTALDRNLRQVSAPQAWQAGYTGTGAKVAVLDTGIDATHPDVAGQIVEKADFTVEGGDAVDRFGHGTHVAAVAAGTGAASGGARKGVAPGAKLLVGKVLDDSGEGTDSMVIAGMEWAASRAPVVNMSLTGYEPSDGSDPVSLAVEELSAETGTLFVVAAGNAGPVDNSIPSPGAAPSSLAVGAVDGADALAEFSSRGPVLGSKAMKPDLVAPGVEIVAARAAGTTMGRAVDARYVAASGTSMASPHVAGAAALLAQRHPDWRGDQIKAALVGAADPIDTTDPYALGAGRLNAARALSGVVSTSPVVNLGTLTAEKSVEGKLGWLNTGTAAADLALDVAVTDARGKAVPAGVVTLWDSRLHLAAGAAGGVAVHVDRPAPGLYKAVVTARSGGAAMTRTPIAFYVEPPSHDLTIESTAIPGTPEGALGWSTIQVVNLDDPAEFAWAVFGEPGETVSLRVPAGRYSVLGSFMAFSDEVLDERMAMAGDPDVTIGADTTVRMDLAAAERLGATVDGVQTSAGSLGLTYIQTAARGIAWNDFAFAWGESAKAGNVFVVPNDGAAIGTFRAYGAFGLLAPGRLYDLIHLFGNGIPADPTYRVTAAEHATLARIDQRFHRLDVPDSVTMHKRYGFSPEGVFLAEHSTDQLVGTRTDYVSPGYAWVDEAFWNGFVTQEAPQKHAAGSRQSKSWVRQPLRSGFFDDPGSPSGCRPLPPTRTSGNMHLEMVTLVDQHNRFDCLSDGWGLDLTQKLTLERNGRTVGAVDGSIGDFPVPRRNAKYRITYDVDASRSLPVSTRVSTSWTFRSAGPSGTGDVPLPLLAVDYALPLDDANHPTASGTATFTVRQARGVPAQTVTKFTVATSLDGGATWRPTVVTRAGGSFRATLPTPAAGQSVSLKVAATGSAGSGLEQTVIDAYRAG
ncbi:S8 family serine peptidase [Paractinoplanes rishiriensis]|uniref:Peptidase S8/S53 domain-containing protein n=1 Tax=Paractinoplanes rishiriensis TaxID=1050105 RepID=A0A919JYF9_9ACTN|nr:S8 family serine peptidase [Actinoplanes rishiriensis]GIE95607.1 hypothetical protein Ari01nite_30720 [Actinoplanes rishiriensis]